LDTSRVSKIGGNSLIIFEQVTVHFPEHFEVGNETSLAYWIHTSPTNRIEHRFSFCPPLEDKPDNCSIISLIETAKEQLNVSEQCSWRTKINFAFEIDHEEYEEI